ncbi:MAG: methyltransferase domain-containing protein [Myxococcota bacterium]
MPLADASLVYSPELARIHHLYFGDIGAAAARELMARLGAPGGRVVELGVGSGVSTKLLVEAGFEVEGVDTSPAMLDLAAAHAPGARYHRGSLWSFPLTQTRAVTAFGEVLNYVAGDEVPDLERLSRRLVEVRASLEPEGLFLFDLTTLAPLEEEEEGVRGVRFEAEDSFLVMEETQRDGELERVIDSFVLVDGSNLYRRIHEVHRLVLFDPDEVATCLRQAGFRRIDRLDAYDDHPLQEGWTAFACRP